MKNIPLLFCLAILTFSLNAEPVAGQTKPKKRSTAAKKSKPITARTQRSTTRVSVIGELGRKHQIEEAMLRGENLHDGSGELAYIGDINSVPALLNVLKKVPPRENGLMVCTTAHALTALYKLTGANPGITYEDWKAWWDDYNKTREQKK